MHQGIQKTIDFVWDDTVKQSEKSIHTHQDSTGHGHAVLKMSRENTKKTIEALEQRISKLECESLLFVADSYNRTGPSCCLNSW